MRNKTSIALIDADIYAYSCGAATQKTLKGVFEDGEPLIEAEPVAHALALVRGSLERAIDKCRELGYEEFQLYLTGSGNFRDKVAITAPYKGNRDRLARPVHYQAIRDYMVNRWGAVVEEGWEADDAVTAASYAMQHDPERCIIVSQDKDLRTVPGLLYNPRKEVITKISREDAVYNECIQILVGDTVDNIPGCYKVGEKKAPEIIEPRLPVKEMHKRLVQAFEESKTRKGCPYAEREAREVCTEMGRLVHLKRHRKDTWRLRD